MYVKKIILLISWILVSSVGIAQTFAYKYIDPCTGTEKTIQVPSNGITVTYYGQVNTFSANDFYNGGFETWAQGVYSSFGNNNPCASLVGMPTSVNIAQNTAINFLGIVNSLSSLADMAGGASNMLGGSVSSVQTSSGSNSKGDSKNKGGSDKPAENSTSTNAQSNGNAGGSSNPGTTSNNGSSTSSSGSSTTQGSTTQGSSEQGSAPQGGGSTSGGSGEQGSSGSTAGSGTAGSQSSGSTTNGGTANGSGSGTTTGSGTSSTPDQTTTTPEAEGGGKTNLVGGSVGSVQSATSSTTTSSGGKGGAGGAGAKNGNRPSILASSDFVGFNFKNSDVSVGGKVTGGYSSMRWDGKRSHGINADYTTAIKGPNITGFYAFMGKRRIDLISTSVTIGFEKRMTIYGTLALGQMWTLNKPKNLKLLYMLTGSAGQVAGVKFIGTAAIAGGMYDWKVSKRVSVKMLCLYVYAPYVSYYNDVLLKSPHVVLPIIGTNVGITKRFKLNINAGGAWAINESTLNYTIMLGTRMLL